MPSITYWSRLEPTPRSRTLSRSLAARVRDPLWLLSRQWQLGELRGEDAASPAFVTVTQRLGNTVSWSTDGGLREQVAGGPLEPSVVAEGPSPDNVWLAAELGGAFERKLIASGREDLVTSFRAAYPIRLSTEKERDMDPPASRVRSALAGRRVHGLNLLAAAHTASPALPAPSPEDPASVAAVRDSLADLDRWATALGVPDREDSPAWRADRLEYEFQVHAHHPDGAPIKLTAQCRREGSLHWYSFDDLGPLDGAPAELQTTTQTTIPTSVVFRGSPSSRFWAFERGTSNLAAIKPETRELAKLLVLDFLLLSGVDWYMIPLRQPAGTLSAIHGLTVHDVFGQQTEVAGADTLGSPTQPWTVFTLTQRKTQPLGSFLFVPPALRGTAEQGEPFEEVRFARDEAANMAWAIERTLPDAIGGPRPGNRRVSAVSDSDEEQQAAGSLAYRMQTDVPANWMPLLPVAVAPGVRDVRLQLGALRRSADEPATSTPSGRVLQPSAVAGAYTLNEEALPRTGLVVSRQYARARWVDGSTHVWITRRIRRGSGEESSGLRFDVLQG